jgi:SET domain-containing protein
VNVQPQNEDREYSEYATVFYATQDIKKDEEILMDYNDYPTNFDEAGLVDLILADQEG